MVHVKDEGVIDTSIDKIWRFLPDEDKHVHKSIKFLRVLEESETGGTYEVELKNSDGSSTRENTKITSDPPKGFTIEILDGVRKGTKFTHTYTPMGSKTKVQVEGEFYFRGKDDATVKRDTLASLAEGFEEDNAALRTYE